MNIFVANLKKIFKDNFVEKNNKFFLKDKEIVIEEVGKYYPDYVIESKINIKTNGYVEFLIKEVGDVFFRDIEIQDSSLKINISNISNAMCLYLVDSCPDLFNSHASMFRANIELMAEGDSVNIFDVIRRMCIGLFSIKIQKLNENKDIDYEEIAKSCIFNMSMQKSYNFQLISSKEELLERFIPQTRRVVRKQIDIPHLKYNYNLVEYYIQGNSAGVAKIQYLSFYNVLEYQFDQLFYEEQCRSIQNIIVNPKFNHANIKHFKQIVSLFAKKNVFSEREMLENLLNKYLCITDFKSFLEENTYYKENPAYKIKNTKFSSLDTDDLIKKKLVNRVYGIRNAIVHSKESSDNKYLPKDEKYIIPEIPLIKYLAEQIIVNTGAIF